MGRSVQFNPLNLGFLRTSTLPVDSAASVVPGSELDELAQTLMTLSSSRFSDSRKSNPKEQGCIQEKFLARAESSCAPLAGQYVSGRLATVPGSGIQLHRTRQLVGTFAPVHAAKAKGRLALHPQALRRGAEIFIQTVSAPSARHQPSTAQAHQVRTELSPALTEFLFAQKWPLSMAALRAALAKKTEKPQGLIENLLMQGILYRMDEQPFSKLEQKALSDKGLQELRNKIKTEGISGIQQGRVHLEIRDDQGESKIGKAIQAQVSAILHVLWRIHRSNGSSSIETVYDWLVEAVHQRYGDLPVPLVQLGHLELGIGEQLVGQSWREITQAAPSGRWQLFLLEKYFDSFSACGGRIDLTEVDLKKLESHVAGGPVPPAASYAAKVTPFVDQMGHILPWVGFARGPTHHCLMGRAELQFGCQPQRIELSGSPYATIRGPSLHHSEIFRWSPPGDAYIPVSSGVPLRSCTQSQMVDPRSLSLVALNGQLRLFDSKTYQVILPAWDSPLALQALKDPVEIILYVLAHGRSPNWIGWSWGSLSRLPFLPEIRYKGMLLTPASVSSSQNGPLDTSRRSLWTNGDKEIFSHNLKHLTKAKQESFRRVILPKNYELRLVDGESGQKYFGQMMLAFESVKESPSRADQEVSKKSNSTFFDPQKVVNLFLWLPSSEHPSLLKKLQLMKREKKQRRWYFVSYADGKSGHSLRLRLFGMNPGAIQKLLHQLKRIQSQSADLIRIEIRSHIRLDQLYLSPSLFDLYEQWSCIDSPSALGFRQRISHMNTEDQNAHCVAYLQEFTKGLLDSFELSNEERRLFHLRFLRGQGKGLPPSWARQAVVQSQKRVPPYVVDCASASIADSSKVFRMMRQQLSSEPDRLHYLHRLCHMVKTRIAPTWSRDGETYVFKCLTGKLLNGQSMRS